MTSMSDSHFDAIATVYDESLPAHVVEHYLRKRVAFLTAVCPGGRGRRALDVGCGTGVLAQRLAERGYTVTGVDPSEGMLEVMRRQSPQTTAMRASGTELPFPDGRYDLVYTVATLHHIAEPGAVAGTLAEMVRVTRPGGRIVIWDHNPRNPYWSQLMARVPQDTGEERLVGEREVMDGLMAAGARILSAQQLGLVPDFTPPRLVRPAAAVERWFEGMPRLRSLAAHNVIVAGKDAQPLRASS
jgi:ubiquinone/menaquinone biosynthesis C-methylase UbiE